MGLTKRKRASRARCFARVSSDTGACLYPSAFFRAHNDFGLEVFEKRTP